MGNNKSKGSAQPTADRKDSRKKNTAKTGSKRARNTKKQPQTSEVNIARTSTTPHQPSDAPRKANHRLLATPSSDNQEEIFVGEQTTQDRPLNFVDSHLNTTTTSYVSTRKEEKVFPQRQYQPVPSTINQTGRGSRNSNVSSRSHAADDLLCQQNDRGFVNSDVDANSMSHVASSYEDSNYYTQSSGAYSNAYSTYERPSRCCSAYSRPSTAQSNRYRSQSFNPTEISTFPRMTSSSTQRNSARPSGNTSEIQTGRHHRDTTAGHGHARSASLFVFYPNQFEYGGNEPRNLPIDAVGWQTTLPNHTRSCEQLDNPSGADIHERVWRLSNDMRTLSREFAHLSNSHIALSISHQKLVQQHEEQEELLMKARAHENNIQAQS